MKLYQVDAFADRPFVGNPAAVCLLDSKPRDDWMQSVAMEMNLSETAFVLDTDDANVFGLRWFTPSTEVDLCGHATLAAAHVLWESGTVEAGDQIRFDTRSGRLGCQRAQEPGWIEMDFPACPPLEVAARSAEALLAEALGAEPVWIGRNVDDVYVLLDSEQAVRDLSPTLRKLGAIEARGVGVTAAADGKSGIEGLDFISRFFAPQSGVDEDPVTGSAHTALAPFWAERLGKTDLIGYQASLRGGVVRMRLEGERVAIAGQAITVLEGRLR